MFEMETAIINIGYINFILSCVRCECVLVARYSRVQWSSCVICCSSDSDGDSDSDSFSDSDGDSDGDSDTESDSDSFSDGDGDNDGDSDGDSDTEGDSDSDSDGDSDGDSDFSESADLRVGTRERDWFAGLVSECVSE